MWQRAFVCALMLFLAGCQSGEMRQAQESQRFILDSQPSFWNRPGDQANLEK
jgi:hypothetical protein